MRTVSSPAAPAQDVTPDPIDPVAVLGVAASVLRGLGTPDDVIREAMHHALRVEVSAQVSADVLGIVRRAAGEIQVRLPSRISTDAMADRYRPLTHPDGVCQRPYCLARVQVDEVTGRAWHNEGVHRRDVRSLELDYGVLAQVGIGVSDDFDLDIDSPFVHAWIADLDDNDEAAYELQLTADEADLIGGFLKDAAHELRSTKDRIAWQAALEAADAATAERFPHLTDETVPAGPAATTAAATQC